MASKQGHASRGRRKLLRWMANGSTRERGQTAIARALDLSQAAVRQWVVGISRPEPRHRVALEALTGIPAGDWELREERKALQRTLKRLARAVPSAS
jgi:DNA-binding transcriptional regulator YdaS (Cro superfamily)